MKPQRPDLKPQEGLVFTVMSAREKMKIHVNLISSKRKIHNRMHARFGVKRKKNSGWDVIDRRREGGGREECLSCKGGKVIHHSSRVGIMNGCIGHSRIGGRIILNYPGCLICRYAVPYIGYFWLYWISLTRSINSLKGKAKLWLR